MLKEIASKIRTALDSFVRPKLLVIRKKALRLLGRSNRRVLFELLVVILLLSSVGVAVSRWSTTTISSHGNLSIDGVGVYDDSDCLVPTTYLDWGTLEPESTRNITVYIRNEGNHRVSIFMTVGNWNPVNASSYMQLSWNYGGQALNPEEVVEITLTLSISAAVGNILDFSFDIMIGTNE